MKLISIRYGGRLKGCQWNIIENLVHHLIDPTGENNFNITSRYVSLRYIILI